MGRRNETVITKELVAKTDNREGCKIYLKETGTQIAVIRYYNRSTQALNGEFLKRIMRAIERYMREAEKSALEEERNY